MSFRCTLCPHRCGAIRDNIRGEGRCRMPAVPRLARAALHFGEEPPLTGQHGSGTVFFSGCALTCVFCQNHAISHDDFGKNISVAALSDVFHRLVDEGAENINLVNPTHYAHVIIKALERYKPPVPVVYNSSGYERVETLKALEGAVDVYLPDYKYADNALAFAFSGVERYRETALAAIAEMRRQTGDLHIANGKAVRGTMVRHLVLPGHTKNSLAALTDLRDSFSNTLWVSLLFQYTPVLPLPQKPLNRTLTARECQKVFDMLCELGLTNGFVQDRTSATTHMIPAFDLTGIE